MHPKAKQWNEENGVNTEWPKGEPWPKDKPQPTNRPCDWCGELVGEGFIHKECLKLEADYWWDIIG